MFGLPEQPARLFSDLLDVADYIGKDRGRQHFEWESIYDCYHNYLPLLLISD